MESLQRQILKNLVFVTSSLLLSYANIAGNYEPCSWENPYDHIQSRASSRIKVKLDRLADMGERALCDSCVDTITISFDLFRQTLGEREDMEQSA